MVEHRILRCCVEPPPNQKPKPGRVYEAKRVIAFAVLLVVLAAPAWNADAQYNLALMYKKGRGVPQDYVQAHMWLNLAGAQGHRQAAKYRGIIAERMTPAQIAEAKRLAGKWRPRRQSGAALNN